MKNFAQISGALQYIDSHLDEPITLEMLAEKFFLSPYYFHKLFSAIVGKPLAAYIRDRRVLHACRQLCQTEKTILDIPSGKRATSTPHTLSWNCPPANTPLSTSMSPMGTRAKTARWTSG